MSLRQKYLEVVSRLVTPSAVGVAVLLGTAVPGAASQDPPTVRPGERVSERLAAIRDAVSTVAAEAGDKTDERIGAGRERRLAWGNWRNGGGFGWGFGRPWGNFGFGGPWRNWNNWHNGWHNWGNRWGNW